MKKKTFLIYAAMASVSLGLSAELSATPLTYPAKDPRFTVEVPVGWTASTNGKGALIIRKDEVVVVFDQRLSHVTDELSAKTVVSLQQQIVEKAPELKELTEIVPAKRMPFNANLKMAVGAKYSATRSDGTPVVYLVGLFSPHGVNYYSMEMICPEKVREASREQRHAIIASITPIKQSNLLRQ